MTILVSGATGTVGKHVVEQLVNKKVQVRAVTRNPKKANFPEGVEVVVGDLMSPKTLISALQDVTAIYLITSSDQVDATLETDPQIVELAEEAGVKRISLLTVYGDGPVEQAIKNSHLEWTFVQPVGFMANAIDDWQESIQKEGAVCMLGGENRTAIVHEADIAAVFVETLLGDKYHGNFYTLTGPEALSAIEQVEIISKVIGKEIKFKELTEAQARNRWQEIGLDEESIDFMVQMSNNPPEIGYTVLPTIECITGHSAKTFAEWAHEHKKHFIK
ncbi:MAG: NAD(P)H-binding protein [Tetragenococcus koreensis]|uniref:NAD(P)H-binding protein n=1 Tax=Tetragenococcus halophilus TaxID=51669 RepID=UPI001F42BEF6|nr:NAD(P)H-binding protein [Tetragenococcus halophilus]MDN6140472.1 NAD(P)H-binding protein [Tetragenococcus koreensis]MDN6385678.1 NAD(P)H-binding protein [Alkalibacterium sp.]MDN6749776.1 NAD(P)H-binding protein [Staphylococcus equorum]MCF1675043.1 NAD(P)H-binding protein [Tetragenococcus halophilus]MDN6146900.1 NAD(P)H-binding protein [Tetragenococcus koreensis]